MAELILISWVRGKSDRFGGSDLGKKATIRVLTIDDHALFRQGLVMLLPGIFPGCEVVEAGSIDEALDILEQTPIDIVLLDLVMPGMSGFDGLRLISRSWPSVPVVVISSSESNADVHKAFNGGARGYIVKSATAKILQFALPLVAAGEMYIPPITVQSMCTRINGPCDGGGAESELTLSPDLVQLTPRQKEVLSEMALGLSNKEIARKLGMLEGTVKVHVKAILQKLNVRNRTEAVMISLRNGAIEERVDGTA